MPVKTLYHNSPEYDQIKFFHFRDLGEYSDAFRACTAAVISCGGRVFVGLAVCSNSDQFSKAVGRAIAQGRAEKKLALGLAVDTDGWVEQGDIDRGSCEALHRVASLEADCHLNALMWSRIDMTAWE